MVEDYRGVHAAREKDADRPVGDHVIAYDILHEGGETLREFLLG
jgi:hypothetical protein